MHACREHILILKLHRLMTDSRGSHKLLPWILRSEEEFSNLMLVTQAINIHVWNEIWQVVICCAKFFHFKTANQKKNETQFSNPISTADFFHEFKTDFCWISILLEVLKRRKENPITNFGNLWARKCSICSQMAMSVPAFSIALVLSESQSRDDPTSSD